MTNKQRLFVNEYLIDFNATRAYKKVYPNVKSNQTAGANGHKLLKNAEIKAFIEERVREIEKRTEITQDRVVKELASIAFSNGADYARVYKREKIIINDNGVAVVLRNPDGTPMLEEAIEFYDTDELNEVQKKAISSIKYGKNGVEVNTFEKVRALELLGKHLGLFSDKVDITANVKNTELTELLEQRRKKNQNATK